MPVDIILDIARYHYEKAIRLRNSRPRGEKNKERMALDLKAEHALALDAATKAAPFYHPKLATLQSNINLDGRITLEDLVTASLPAPANNNDTVEEITESVDENAALVEKNMLGQA